MPMLIYRREMKRCMSCMVNELNGLGCSDCPCTGRPPGCTPQDARRPPERSAYHPNPARHAWKETCGSSTRCLLWSRNPVILPREKHREQCCKAVEIILLCSAEKCHFCRSKPHHSALQSTSGARVASGESLEQRYTVLTEHTLEPFSNLARHGRMENPSKGLFLEPRTGKSYGCVRSQSSWSRRGIRAPDATCQKSLFFRSVVLTGQTFQLRI